MYEKIRRVQARTNFRAIRFPFRAIRWATVGVATAVGGWMTLAVFDDISIGLERRSAMLLIVSMASCSSGVTY